MQQEENSQTETESVEAKATNTKTQAKAKPASKKRGEVDKLTAILEAMQTNVFLASPELDLVYINQAGIRTLRGFEDELQRVFGLSVDDVIGGSIHRFHRDPKRVEEILRQPGRLPHNAEFSFGRITLRARVNAYRTGGGDLLGYVVTWEDFSEERRMREQMERTYSMMQTAPINVMWADHDAVIRYANPSSLRQLKRVEQFLPCKADEVVGQCIDIFHKNPGRIRKILADPNNLPHRAIIQVGDQKLDLLVTATTGADGEYLGPMVTWRIVTNEQALKDGLVGSSDELQAVAQRLSERSSHASVTAGQASSAAEEISRSTQSVATGLEEMSASIKEIASNAQKAASVADEAVRLSHGAHDSIESLDKRSTEISEVIDLITQIAQQTKMLALNATIEAARAGEAGKGFGVVAGEVKELAKETADATKQIARKVLAIQDSTRATVSSISEVGDIIRKINDFQSMIATAVEEQSVTSADISRSVDEVARGTAEIARNVSGIAQAAEETKGEASATQQASDRLSSLAGDLEDMLKNR